MIENLNNIIGTAVYWTFHDLGLGPNGDGIVIGLARYLEFEIEVEYRPEYPNTPWRWNTSLSYQTSGTVKD